MKSPGYESRRMNPASPIHRALFCSPATSSPDERSISSTWPNVWLVKLRSNLLDFGLASKSNRDKIVSRYNTAQSMDTHLPSYNDLATQTAMNLRAVTQSQLVRDLSHLSLPEIEAVI